MNFTPTTVPWREGCSTVTEALSYMLEKEILVDVVFKKSEVCRLYAHKLILSLWSPIFANLMTQVDKTEILSIRFDEDMDVVESVIKYMYSSDAKNWFAKMPFEKLIQVIEFAKRYEMVQIRQKCICLLERRKISPQNVIKFFDFGLRNDFENIIRKCIKVFKFKGISQQILKGDVLLITILSILDLDRIALRSEADLLSLIISWLSYPSNKHFRSRVLSYIDLRSIDWTEYNHILKKYPNFFTDSELCAIFLGVIRQNAKLFPEWYKQTIISEVVKDCSLCLSVLKQLKFPKELHLKKFQQKNSAKFCLKFEFVYYWDVKARLMNIELNFGPQEIPEEKFRVFFRTTGINNFKECSINSSYGGYKYAILFPESVLLNSGGSLTLKFNFKNSVIDKLHVFSPNVIEKKKINKALNKDPVEVILSSKVAYYISETKSPVFLISTFSFSFCEHDIYLSRKHVVPDNIENSTTIIVEDDDSPAETNNMENDFKIKIEPNFHSKSEEFKINIKSPDDTEQCFTDEVLISHIKQEVTEEEME